MTAPEFAGWLLRLSRHPEARPAVATVTVRVRTVSQPAQPADHPLLIGHGGARAGLVLAGDREAQCARQALAYRKAVAVQQLALPVLERQIDPVEDQLIERIGLDKFVL